MPYADARSACARNGICHPQKPVKNAVFPLFSQPPGKSESDLTTLDIVSNGRSDTTGRVYVGINPAKATALKANPVSLVRFVEVKHCAAYFVKNFP
jgi:hypothetical protein